MTHDISVVTEAQLRAEVALDLALIDVVEKAFIALGEGKVTMPPIASMAFPEAEGEVDIKTAHVSGLDGFAVKVSTGFYRNSDLGLPSLGGLMTLFSASNGRLKAVLLDNGYLTDMRTAAAGAIAARQLAPTDVETAGVIGTGLQARLQIEAAHLVRPFNKVLVWGRDGAKAVACAKDIAERINVEALAVNDPAMLVRDSQLVVTTTPAREPLLKAEWLHPGLHITAMGSDQAGKQEIDARAIAECDLYVCDSIAQCEALGELRALRASGLAMSSDPVELGKLITGSSVGRQSQGDVTICDLTGTGAQDTVIANHAFGRAGSKEGVSIIST